MINPNTFDLNLLRIFEALAEERSVSATARRVGLSQPAVSNALNRLRELLDDPLFVRSGKGMEPTALAASLQEPFAQSLATVRAALRLDTVFEPLTSKRTFTLIMIDVGEITFLPQLMRRLSTAGPDISLRVLELGREYYEDYLENGTADLAIGRIKLRDTFQSAPLLEETYVALLASDHPALETTTDGRQRISCESYLRARHIAVLPRGKEGNPVEAALMRDGKQRRLALSIPHTMVLSAILPGTDLIATVPEICSHVLCGKNSRLCSVKLPFDLEPIKVLLWWHKRREYDPGHHWFRQTISELSGSLLNRGGRRLPEPQADSV